jgi:hypothetical protein
MITATGDSRNRVAAFMPFRVHMALEPVAADKPCRDRNGDSGDFERNRLVSTVDLLLLVPLAGRAWR